MSLRLLYLIFARLVGWLILLARVAGFYFEDDQHVDPAQRHRIDVEEVDRQRR